MKLVTVKYCAAEVAEYIKHIMIFYEVYDEKRK